MDHFLVEKELSKLSRKAKADSARRFFKTGPGEYGEGDIFIGVRVPEIRRVAKNYQDLSLAETKKLLRSSIHEHRFVALEILVFKYESGRAEEQERVVKFYLKEIRSVNNWDLVDTSAPYILGHWLLQRDKQILFNLAHSNNLWERRIAIVATLGLIKQGHFGETLRLVELLIDDEEDLIHKACGWMLREVGKKSLVTLTNFLDKRASRLPRTTLRYAIERFHSPQRKFYLKMV